MQAKKLQEGKDRKVSCINIKSNNLKQEEVEFVSRIKVGITSKNQYNFQY